MIYLDNAATTLRKPPEVARAVAQALDIMGNAARGAHDGALNAARAVYDARVKLARLFGCDSPGRVILTANSTEALNIAIFGTLDSGDHVVTTDLEHNSVLRPLYALREERGVQLDFAPADERGNVDYDDFERLVKPNTKAIVCTHASNLTGNALDLRRVAAIAKARGLLFIVDASQTAGSFSIDIESLGVDVLCFTGHKGLFGPQGTGGMCLREGVEIRPFKRGGSGVQSYNTRQPDEYPARLEAGTLNSHGIAGLSAALDFVGRVGVSAIASRERALMRRFYEGVRAIGGVKVYGDFSTDERAAIVALNIRDYDSGAVSDALSRDYGVATRPGAHCAPRMHRALGTVEQGAVRFSFSWFNTQDEADAAIRAVKEIAAN